MAQTVPKRGLVASWCFYDWANSAFATTVLAGFFPLYFTSLVPSDEPGKATLALGMVNSGTSLVVALLSPILGVIADRGRSQRLWLLLFAALGVLGTALLAVPSSWPFVAFAFGVGLIGFNGSLVFYDALLPSVARTEKDLHRVSALGFACGYAGGGIQFALCVALFSFYASVGLHSPQEAVRLSFLFTAVWWALFSLPILRLPAAPASTSSVSPNERLNWSGTSGGNLHDMTRQTVADLKCTARELVCHKALTYFLLAYWLYIDGINTIIKMALQYGQTLGLPHSALIGALLMVQFIAFPAAIAYGRFATMVTPIRSIQAGVLVYAALCLLASFISRPWHFYALAVGIGLVQGGVQSVSRSVFLSWVPQGKETAFSSLLNIVGRFASVLGPMLMGVVGYLTGSTRFGVLSLWVLFGGGLILLTVAKKHHSLPDRGT